MCHGRMLACPAGVAIKMSRAKRLGYVHGRQLYKPRLLEITSLATLEGRRRAIREGRGRQSQFELATNGIQLNTWTRHPTNDEDVWC